MSIVAAVAVAGTLTFTLGGVGLEPLPMPRPGFEPPPAFVTGTHGERHATTERTADDDETSEEGVDAAGVDVLTPGDALGLAAPPAPPVAAIPSRPDPRPIDDAAGTPPSLDVANATLGNAASEPVRGPIDARRMGALASMAVALMAAWLSRAMPSRRHRAPGVTPGQGRPDPTGPDGAPDGIPGDIVFVVIPGHGSDPTGTFDQLLDAAGVPDDQRFEVTYVATQAGDGHTSASEVVDIERLAAVLHATLLALAADGKRIYLVGHSKGAVAAAVTLAWMDAHPQGRIPGLMGAMLLDPPMESGVLGTLQGIGRHIGAIPDNGGYDPIVSVGLFGSRDTRADLGRDAGVEVVVIRNPDALVTNFHGTPDGLRVLDLVDDGGDPAWHHWPSPLAIVGRIKEAHESVLTHGAVAACLRAEARRLGSCRWTADREPRRRIGWGPASGGAMVVVE